MSESRSSKLRRWLDVFERHAPTCRTASPSTVDAYAGALGSMREAWRDELRLELAEADERDRRSDCQPPRTPDRATGGTWCPAVRRYLTDAELVECGALGCVGAYCARVT